MTIRMGFHRHTGKRDDMFKAYVDKVRPQFVKFLDGFPQDLADYCHARGTRIIGRVYFQTQKLGAEGSRQMQQVVQTAREKPWVDYWELHNEDWQHGQEMERYAELCIEFMGELDRIGKKAAIGCFSTGQPEVSEWSRFLPALRHAAAHGHAWAVHEYGGGPPGAKWGVGRNQWNNGQPVTDDPCDDPGTRYLGWWCLRYRRAVDEMKRLGLTTIPDLLITEALIDDIQPRPGNVGKGYKDFRGQHPPTVGDYADQWAWYCRQLSQDPFVIGAVDFGWATEDPTWNSFDVSTDLVTFDRLIQTMTALQDAPPAPPNPPPPPEAPMLQGIDVSHWQGTVDWRKAASAGAVYAWLKATDGSTYVDPEYARNAAGARDAGLLHGPYHYFRNSIDPILQAEHFARVVKAGPEPTLPPALDFEDTTGEINAVNIRRFVERVNALLGRPIIYTGAWFWTPARLGGTQEWAKLFPLWIADYDGSVSIPSDWRDWTVHQYTSSGDGIAFGADSARIDRNRYRGTREELAALRIPPPAPPSSIDVAKLWAQAAANQAIRLNPAAGLQRAILAAGLEVVSNEWDYDEAHVAQLGQGAAAGSKQAVYVYDKGTGRIIRHNQP